MSVAIRYFSKFGHSKLMAEAVSQVAGVPALDVNEPLDGEVEILFLGAGLFLGKVDGSVGAFIKTLSPEKVGKVVCFGSCVIKKSPVPELKKLLEAQGLNVAVESFSCKGAMGPIYKGHPDSKDLALLQEFARGILG